MYHLILVLVAGYLGCLLPFRFHFLHIPVQTGHYLIMICVILKKKNRIPHHKRHKSSYLSINWSSFLCLSEICNLISCNLFLKLLFSNARQLWSKTLKCLFVKCLDMKQSQIANMAYLCNTSAQLTLPSSICLPELLNSNVFAQK